MEPIRKRLTRKMRTSATITFSDQGQTERSWAVRDPVRESKPLVETSIQRFRTSNNRFGPETASVVRQM